MLSKRARDSVWDTPTRTKSYPQGDTRLRVAVHCTSASRSAGLSSQRMSSPRQRSTTGPCVQRPTAAPVHRVDAAAGFTIDGYARKRACRIAAADHRRGVSGRLAAGSLSRLIEQKPIGQQESLWVRPLHYLV